MKKSNKIVVGIKVAIIVAIIAAVGIHEYYTMMPAGATDRPTIMNKAADAIDTDLGIDMEWNPYDVSNDSDEYRIFLYRNTRTNRFVFPIKDKKTKKIHYCYLVSYEGVTGYTTKMAVDINDSNWVRFIQEQVATIEGNNPAEKDYEYSIFYYYQHFSKLTDYDYIFY